MTISSRKAVSPPVIARPTPLRPTPNARATPAPVGSRDELSTSRAQVFKQALGSAGTQGQFDVKELRAARAASKLRALVGDSMQGRVLTAASALGGPAAVKTRASQNLENVQSSSDLARALSAEPDAAIRNEMIKQAMNSPNAAALFTSYGSGAIPQPANRGYDELSVIAGAVDSAVRAGAVTQADMNVAVSHMSEGDAELFVQALSIDGNNRAGGGAVELFGLAARAQGYERAEALALTSTDFLIDKYYPTEAAQRGAFEQVKDFIEERDDVLSGNGSELPIWANALQFAIGSAARLTSRGTGYAPGALEAELKELGPRFTQETIARLGNATRFDGHVPGAIDALADAATTLSKAGGRNAGEFEVAAALGYTQSRQLISENLKTPEARARTLEVLNTFLAGRRDEFRDAATSNPPYELLRDPQAIEGITELLAADPNLLRSLVTGSPEQQATLVQILESVSFNPAVPTELREGLQAQLDALTRALLKEGGSASNVGGGALGTFFGLVQVAGNRAVEAAGERGGPTSDAEQKFATDVITGIVGAALAPAGPVASILGGAVLNQVLGEILGAPPAPSSQQLRNALRDWLTKEGIDVSNGQKASEAFDRFLGTVLDALHDITPQTVALQAKINELEELKDAATAGYLRTLESADGAGETLNGALEGRDDEP